ncbi:SusC/RagA family TonB-linked outer membrane protein [Mucilaginibacter terrae]|uniref:TonB-linked SusC/RagA family outer membrane protein n=1 Tax=Mucilaginibacter terrae TaxID=1955052 RepID=A0ABU3GQZ7_9SPHI|nr:TonB-dependent receptor [Mucilaginibacter terrae]MDT3401377.1 TonB-linked SusC/RagA family outer membrane protein [Mucilaginibacter terrae]
MKKVLLLSFMLFFLCSAWAQTKTVNGKVTDEHGDPLPNSTVKVQGTSTTTVTSVDGVFKITIPGPQSVLVITYLGYKNKEIRIGNQTQITVSLEPDFKALNEVVAIGYQTVRRRDLVGAVSSLTDKDLRDNPTLSAAEAIQGKLAGVQVTIADGQPGASADIYVRGRNSITQSGSPLYIVDGVQIDNALNVLSPQDIASIDVLKDAASTSIYGARGANGVIIITTKGGKNTNGKTSVNYNNSMAIQKMPKELDVMKPFDYVQFQYERAKITGDTTFVTRFVRNSDPYSKVLGYQNSDFLNWQDIMFGRSALQQTHNLTINGGTKQTQYNLSATYNDQQGILLFTRYKRGLINFRFDHQASQKLKVGFNVRYNNNVLLGQGTTDPGSASNSNLRQIVRYIPLQIANQPIDYYDAAEATATSGNGLSLINPLQEFQQEYRKRSNNAMNLNAYLNFNVVKNVTARTVAAIDYNNTNSRSFDDTVTYNSRTTGAKQPLILVGNNNIRTINHSTTLNYNNQSLFKSKHAIDILLGEELYQTFTWINGLDLRNFPIGTSPDQAFANYSLAQTVQPPTVSEVPVRNFSVFSRLSYNYAGKYFATFNLRADGSSVFGPLNKWGYFPSGSVAWRVSDEEFMKSQNIVSDLKFRASYGTVGNNRITPYSFGNFFAPGRSYFLNDQFNFGAATAALGNPNLKWESQISRNIGLDIAFFKGRFQLTVDAYRNTTSNLLLNNVIPVNSGYGSQFQNVGATQNKGLEIQFNGTIIQNKDFRWGASFNISWNKNIIKSLGDQQFFTVNSGFFNTAQQPADYLVKVGEEVGTFYGLVNDGYYQISDFNTAPYSNTAYPFATTRYTLKPGIPVSGITSTTLQPGTQKFKDINNDGRVTTADFTVLGHALPRGIGGFGQNFAWKGFDASIFLNFSYGGKIANYNKLEFTSTYSNGANLLSDFNDRYRTVDPATGAQVQYASAATGAIGASPEVLQALNANARYWIPVQSVEWNNNQSYALENASFIRVNTVTIGYTLPAKLTQKYSITNLRVFITGNNLGTITGYSGYDPDVSTRRSSPVTAGADYSAFPRARVFVAGLNLTF